MQMQAAHAAQDAGPLLKFEDIRDVRVDNAASDAFLDALFEPPKTAYAVVDAARAQALPEWLGGTGLTYDCLFTGDARENYGDVAPWLIQLTPDAPLIKAMFAQGEPKLMQLWGANAGLFLRSDAPFKRVNDHLRRLTRIKGPDDAWVYFRFWDPTVAFDYFPQVANWPTRVQSVFQSRHLQDLEFIVPNSTLNSARHITQATAHSARSGSHIQRLSHTAGIRMEARDLAIFEAQKKPQLRAELANWLVRLDPKRFRPFGNARRMAVADHVLTEGARFGFKFKEEYAYFLYMMTFLGGWFHRAPDYKLFVAQFEPLRPTRYKEISEGFAADYAAHIPDAAVRDAVLRNIVKQARAIPGGAAQATLADLKAFASRAEHLLPAEAGTQAARDETLQSCAALGLKDQRAQAFFYLLRLTLGPLPHQDPLQPWLSEKLFATGPKVSSLAKTADYALRRLGTIL